MQDAMMAASDDYEGGVAVPEIDVGTLVSWIEDAEEASDGARKGAERDRDYYDHKQLTSAEKATLRKRGQPDVIINRIKPKIDYLLGFEASTRTDPRAFPRTPVDEGAAEACSDALRYVGDSTEINQKFSAAWENMLIEGYGGIELTVEQKPVNPQTGKPSEIEIGIVGWDWDRLFYDPHSRKVDFSDARYLGGYVWMDVEEAKESYPDAADIIDTTVSDTSFTTTYEDRPRWKTWVSGQSRKRIRVVQMYHKSGGQWQYCVFTKGGKLDTYPVPFTDQDGMSWCPLILQSAYVDRDNNRYGLVRSMIDVQDEINKRRSKALHRLTMRQVVTEHGAVEDEDATKLELSKPDGLITVNPGFRFEMLQSGEQLSAELALLQEAKNEIEMMGPNSAMQGKDGDAPSGVAIRLNASSGQTEISMLLDRHLHLKQRTYRRIWDLIRQYKTEEWWIRVTDNEDNVKFVGINRPVKLGEDIAKQLADKKMPPEQIEQALQQAAADPMRGPQLDQVVRVENRPTEMYMDITIEQVPDVANTMQEQFDGLIKLAQAGVVMPPEVYLQASSLRNKKELIEKLEGGDASPEEQQAKQAAMKIEFSKAQAEVDKILADIDKTRAETAKISVEADMAMMPAGQIQMPQIMPPIATPPMGPPMGAPPQMPEAMPMPPPGPPDGMPPELVQSVPTPGLTGDDVGLQPPPGIIGRDMGQL